MSSKGLETQKIQSISRLRFNTSVRIKTALISKSKVQQPTIHPQLTPIIRQASPCVCPGTTMHTSMPMQVYSQRTLLLLLALSALSHLKEPTERVLICSTKSRRASLARPALTRWPLTTVVTSPISNLSRSIIRKMESIHRNSGISTHTSSEDHIKVA